MRDGRAARGAKLATVLALALAPAIVASSAGGGIGAGAATRKACGTKTLYGRTLQISVRGDAIACSRVRRIIRGKCHETRHWSCFSFWPPDPVLVWFKERERFARHWSTVVEARRPPCSDSPVTAEAWDSARHDTSSAFPTRQQVLADDLVRCKLLRGKSHGEAVQLLGRPDETATSRGKRSIHYEIGPERDSFFQIDSEFLLITFDRGGTYESARFYQG